MTLKRFLAALGWLASLAAALFTETDPDEAQEKSNKEKEPWLVYYLVGPGAPLDAEPMREALEEKGYPMPETPIYTVLHGGGGNGPRKGGPWLFGGEGGGCGNQDIGEQYSTFPGGGEGTIYAGYVIKLLEWLRIYPLLGVGGGGTGITVAETDPDHPMHPTKDKSKRVARGEVGALVNVGVGVEAMLGGKFGVVLGVRVGYTFDPLRMVTKTHNMNKGYVRFLIGAGRLRL